MEARLDESDAQRAQAARVDPAAFSALYAGFHARVFRYLRLRAPSDEEAADLTQQVFVQALDALPRYDERGAPFAAWLFRIARNAAIDAQRKRRPTVDIGLLPDALLLSDEGNPEAEALRQERLERLRVLLGGLDQGQRELLALRFAGGLTAREIAVVVGRREGAVKRQLSRLIQQLREQYGER
ncbi:MAG TPA: sigma-70 family RNA polymerase sigma factor [Thermomicrobiales bacterium]|nr:sigma-70 family RNA polymerase sigma factor [Thermomicrobiales bacterium]